LPRLEARRGERGKGRKGNDEKRLDNDERSEERVRQLRARRATRP
jgi:hypothetical protein